MPWLNSETRLYLPETLNLDVMSSANIGFNLSITASYSHYKRSGIEYHDYYKGAGFTGEVGKWITFKENKPRLQYYNNMDGNNGWGIRTNDGWEAGLDELPYLTFDNNPSRLNAITNLIEMGAYWENEIVAETPTTITYDGNEIATLEAGQTATLSCNGKKMASDVVVAFGADGSVTYNGKKTSVSSGQTATLSCSGEVMARDVVITV